MNGWMTLRLDMIESVIKNVFGSQIPPVRGAVLRIDLVGGVVKHSAIYVGDDRVVEVYEENGEATVRCIRPNDFLNAGQLRTGAYIYVAAYHGMVLGSDDIADRALHAAWDGVASRGEYTLLDNNCHRFTKYCILGRDDPTPSWSDSDLEDALKERFGVDSIEWVSTGFGAASQSFGNAGRTDPQSCWADKDHVFSDVELLEIVEHGVSALQIPDWGTEERVEAVQRLMDAFEHYLDKLNIADDSQFELYAKVSSFYNSLSQKMREEMVVELGG